MRVFFTLGYDGDYSLEFEGDYLFPRKYLMVVRTHMDIGGIYDIYVNDVFLKRDDELENTFDYDEFLQYWGIVYSVTGERYIPQDRFNNFDMYVDVQEFGRPSIRFEYKGPGQAPSHGLVIDFIDFVPVEN
jgi:hypothetical protein